MVIVSSPYLKDGDRALIHKYTGFVFRKLAVRPALIRNSLINVRIIRPADLCYEDDRRDMKKNAAWCTYRGIENGKKKFTLVVAAASINKLGKKPLTRLKRVMIDMGHELVHVKQYLNNEMFDYVCGDVRYKGDVFQAMHETDEEAYYNSPWEIEAFGREWGLYKMFKNHLKEEAKAGSYYV